MIATFSGLIRCIIIPTCLFCVAILLPTRLGIYIARIMSNPEFVFITLTVFGVVRQGCLHTIMFHHSML